MTLSTEERKQLVSYEEQQVMVLYQEMKEFIGTVEQLILEED